MKCPKETGPDIIDTTKQSNVPLETERTKEGIGQCMMMVLESLP